MKIVNMNGAKTKLLKLLRETSNGVPFLFAKAGYNLESWKFKDPYEFKRLGLRLVKESFLLIFNSMGSSEIESMFYEEWVNFLLETHILIWAAISPHKFSSELASLLYDPSHHLYFISASIGEISIEENLGKIILKLCQRN